MAPLFIKATETTLIDLVFLCLREALEKQNQMPDDEWQTTCILLDTIYDHLREPEVAPGQREGLPGYFPRDPAALGHLLGNAVTVTKEECVKLKALLSGSKDVPLEFFAEADRAYGHLIRIQDEVLAAQIHYGAIALKKIK